MNTLYTLPLGETKRYDFIKEAGRYQYGHALIVVPGKYFRWEVNKAGTARSAIIDYLPNEILRINNQEGNFIRISRAAQEMLLEQILLELEAAGKLTYFAQLVDKSGFTKTFASFLSELARGGVTTEQLTTALSSWGRGGSLAQKDMEVALIYAVYSERIKNSTYYDVDGLYRLAIALLDKGKAKLPWQKLYFTEFYQFNSLQLELIKSLSKYCDIAVGLFYDKTKPALAEATREAYEDLQSLGFTEVKEKTTVHREQDLQQLMDNWHGSSNDLIIAKHVQVRETYSLDAEMRLVLSKLKDLLLAGVKQEEIICLVRHLDDYNGFSDLFTEYGIPTTLAKVTNFSGQLLPDFLTRLFNTGLNPQDVETWQKLLAHPLCKQLYGLDNESLEESYNDNFFATPQALLKYAKQECEGEKLSNLDALVRSLGKKHTPQEYKEEILAALQNWNLLKLWGDSFSKDELTLSELKVMAASSKAVEDLLQAFLLSFEQSGQSETKITLGDFLDFWQEQSKEILLPVTEEKTKGVLVAEIANMQGVTFPYVFILGMREGVFPSVKQENWIYNDVEREELFRAGGVPLKISQVAMDQERYFFAAALAIATKELNLSYFADDAAGASSYLENFKSYFDTDSLPVEKWSENIANCASEQALLKLLALQADNCKPHDEAWAESYWGRDFRSKGSLDTSRWSAGSSYNGNIDRASTYREFSASALDQYLDCPFAYMAGRVWNTEPWQVKTAEVEPTTRGDLFHNTVAKFLARYQQKNLNNFKQEVLQQQLADDFNSIYAKFMSQGKIIDSSFAAYEKDDMLQALENWLHMEREYQAQEEFELLPYAFEQAFGRNVEGSWPALQLEVNDEIIKFSGQIDRIDFDGTRYMITDYKTGGYPTGTALKAGQALQLPLYVLALEQNMETTGENILGAGYYSFKEGKRKNGTWQTAVKEKLPWLYRSRAPEMSEVLSVARNSIDNCVQQIKIGMFPAAPLNQKCNAYCPYQDICRYRLSVVNQEAGDDDE